MGVILAPYFLFAYFNQYISKSTITPDTAG